MTATNRRQGQRNAAKRLVPAMVVAMILGTAARVSAEQVVFTLDKANSNYSIVVNDNFYGGSVAQSGGSLTSPVSGHFVVDFNPAAPSQIQFLNGGGYITLDNTGTYQPGGTAGQIGGQNLANDYRYAIRNLVWDWSSSLFPINAGAFNDEDITFHVNSGLFDYFHPFVGVPITLDAAGDSGELQTSSTSFTETSAGHWTVAFSAQLVETYNFLPNTPAGNLTYTATLVAHAVFDDENSTDVDTTGAVETSVAGGAEEIGGIDLAFDNVVTGGTLTAQVINDVGGLTQPALEALGNFQLPGGGVPQIWNLEFDGEFTGTATLVFNYDPDRVGSGALSIIHYDETLDVWEDLGGIVDTVAHTITVETTSFSPFAVAPEPSSLVLAAMAVAVLAAAAVRRRKK